MQQDGAQTQQRKRQPTRPGSLDPLPHVGAYLFNLSDGAKRLGQPTMRTREQRQVGDLFGESQAVACRPQRRGEIALLTKDARSEHHRRALGRGSGRRLDGSEDLPGLARPILPAQRARERQAALVLERLVPERRRRDHEAAQCGFRVGKTEIVGPADRFEQARQDLAFRGVVCARRARGVLVRARQGAARSRHRGELQPVSRRL